jgi:pimeloyl-ACP methyl ester carboxylesterase
VGVGAITRRTVTAGRHRLSYLAAGPQDGAAVVLLHGLASDATTWDRAIEPLAGQGLRVVAVDLLGHGASDKPAEGYLLPDFADSLAKFFEAAGIVDATVCGHSLGGAIAVTFAYHHPDLVSRLVLVSAGGLGREVHRAPSGCSRPRSPSRCGGCTAVPACIACCA